MPDPKHRLRIRAIDTVGFVDKGDDPDAEIVFFKRAPEEEIDVDNTETRNLLQKIYDLVSKNDESVPDPSGDDNTDEGEGTMPFDASELSDEAREHIEKLEAEVEELKAAAEADDSESAEEADPIESLPDEQRSAIEKRLAAQEAEIAKAREEAKAAREEAAIEKRERRLEVFRKQAKEDLTAIQGTTDEVAEMLLAVEDNLDEDMAKRVTDALKAASAQVSESARLTSAIGKHGGDEGPDGPWSQIEKAAEDLREADPELSIEQARTRVMKDPANRAIVEEYRRQRQ